MAGLFGGGGSSKAPPLPPVPPPPVIPQQSAAATDQVPAARTNGFQKTILTGDLEPTPTGKKTLLGG
jgi:hypothetical protein